MADDSKYPAGEYVNGNFYPDGYHGPGSVSRRNGPTNLDPPESDDRPYPEDAPGPVSSPHTSWDARKDLE